MRIQGNFFKVAFAISIFHVAHAFAVPTPELANANANYKISGFSVGITPGTERINKVSAYVLALGFLNHLAWNAYLAFEEVQDFTHPDAPGIQIRVRGDSQSGQDRIQRQILVKTLLEAMSYFSRIGFATNAKFTPKLRNQRIGLVSFVGLSNGPQMKDLDAREPLILLPASQSAVPLKVSNTSSTGSNALEQPPASPVNATNEILNTSVFFNFRYRVEADYFFLIIAHTYAEVAPWNRDLPAGHESISAPSNPLNLEVTSAPGRMDIPPIFCLRHMLRGLFDIVHQAVSKNLYVELDADVDLVYEFEFTELGKISIARPRSQAIK